MNMIKSGGGPLLCIDRNLCAAWLGADGNSAPPMNVDLRLSDYERACASDGYIEKIDILDGFGLVLGDMPLETAVWSCVDGFPAIVRVYYKDPDTDLLQILGRCKRLNDADVLEEITVNFPCGDLIIFDSAFPGAAIKENFLPFDIPVANYRIATKRLEPDDRTSVLVHSFSKA